MTGKTNFSRLFGFPAPLGVVLTLSSPPSLAHGHRPIVVASKADTEGALLVFASLTMANVVDERPARDVAERYLNQLHRPPGA